MYIRLIDVNIYMHITISQVPFLARASHFGYEHASHGIFSEITCTHTWICTFSPVISNCKKLCLSGPNFGAMSTVIYVMVRMT